MPLHDLSKLHSLAAELRDRAHAPYSGFTVGAALITTSKRVFSGCNVENLSYPEGVCAETSAISAMVAAGEASIVELVVLGGPKGGAPKPCAPCGGCRQRIFEFSTPETTVHFIGNGGELYARTIAELLPNAFS
ncbi:MAG: cytidine deaminase [Pseudomonadota bacterium]